MAEEFEKRGFKRNESDATAADRLRASAYPKPLTKKNDPPAASPASSKPTPKNPSPGANAVKFVPPQRNIAGSTAPRYTADASKVQPAKASVSTVGANRLSPEAKKTVTEKGPIKRDVNPSNFKGVREGSAKGSASLPNIQMVDGQKTNRVAEYKAKINQAAQPSLARGRTRST